MARGKEWKDLQHDARFLQKRNEAAADLGRALGKALRTPIEVETSYQYVVVTLTPEEANLLHDHLVVDSGRG